MGKSSCQYLSTPFIMLSSKIRQNVRFSVKIGTPDWYVQWALQQILIHWMLVATNNRALCS